VAADDVPLPVWKWDKAAGALRPKCPRCGASVIDSFGRFTCNMAGFSHYHQKIEHALATLSRRLGVDVGS